MSTFRARADKLAIGLSFVCVIHCLVLPVALIFLPALASLPLQDESFYLWILLAVIPTSLYALTMGCKKHQRYQVVVLGFVGIAFLVSPFVLGEENMTETLEKTLTLIGAVTISLGHMFNFRLCQSNDACEISH